MSGGSICGVWIGPDGQARLSRQTAGNRRAEEEAAFRPFAWADRIPHGNSFQTEELEGNAPFRRLISFENISAYKKVAAKRKTEARIETVRCLENQFLLGRQARLFERMTFGELRRCQLDIETACSVPGGISDPRRAEDRVLAIGLRFSHEKEPRLPVLEENSDQAEKKLLETFREALIEGDPDVIEGHNIFDFDFNYLRLRCQRYNLPCAWGRFGAQAAFRPSRQRAAERWLDFLRCDIPGRAVFDTFLAIRVFDAATRDLLSYRLKDVAVSFGVTVEEDGRTYLPASGIQRAFYEDRQTFLDYLEDDLRETGGVANLLLPTYFAQAKNFPMTLQETFLRGNAHKADLLLLEKYYHARRGLPYYPEVRGFAGGFSKSFAAGVFKHVLHFDVASLYPSLLLAIGRNPAGDSLGIFIPLLKELREYRLKYKDLARETDKAELKTEYRARQTAYKILINSFYGYLGFSGARFADSGLAAEVTRRGRELLQALITEFEKLGCQVLEADTDGIYLAAGDYWEEPERLLDQVKHILPAGIELEYDGRYPAMFCYKAKNYALCDGGKITIRGSALRSRGLEPFLKDLTDRLIAYLLDMTPESPLELAQELRREIQKGTIDIARLAKPEYLSQSPESYREKIERGGKPRRAALETALKMDPRPRAGERVFYYIGPKEKGRSADWQRARPLAAYDPKTAPCDPSYYLKKIDDWLKRYGTFLGFEETSAQEELF